MNNYFTEIFAKQPDEIMDGDYFFNASMWLRDEKLIETVKERVERNFKHYWDNRTLKVEHDPFYTKYRPWTKDTDLINIINKIAFDNKPFLDIASSEGMGLASFILKINPQISCLVTDIDFCAMQYLRRDINEYLNGNNISLASFDNNDIPIKDASLDCITSLYGITNSHNFPDNRTSVAHLYQYSEYTEKAIDEVFRILKPGGCFVTVESNRKCDCDLQKICNRYTEYGKIFGIYDYEEIKTTLGLLTEKPWRDKFIAAGFRIETENKHLRKYTTEDVKSFLYQYTYFNNIREWNDTERVLYSITNENVCLVNSKQNIEEMINRGTLHEILILLKRMVIIENLQPKILSKDEIKNILYKLTESGEFEKYAGIIKNRNYDLGEDTGIDMYHVDTFYVLRKPN